MSLFDPFNAILEPTLYAAGRKARNVGLSLAGSNPDKIAFEDAQNVKSAAKADLLQKQKAATDLEVASKNASAAYGSFGGSNIQSLTNQATKSGKKSILGSF